MKSRKPYLGLIFLIIMILLFGCSDNTIIHEVTFNSNGESIITIVEVIDGERLLEPNSPTKEGHTFIAWYKDSLMTEIWDFDTDVVNNNITLYAKWEKNTYLFTIIQFESYYDPQSQYQLPNGKTIIKPKLGGFDLEAALTYLGNLYMRGMNFSGQVGNGTYNEISSFVNITPHFNLDENERIVDVALGTSHAGALTSYGRVFVWGNNSNNQLGIGDIPTNDTMNRQNIPLDITHFFTLSEDEYIISLDFIKDQSSALSSKGRLFVWGLPTIFYNTIYVKTPQDVTSFFELNEHEKLISTSNTYTSKLILTSQGRVFTWGSNYLGLSGIESDIESGLPIEITSSLNLDDQEIVTQITSNAFAYRHTLLTSNGRLFEWGDFSSYTSNGKIEWIQRTPFETTAFVPLDEDEVLIYLLNYSYFSRLLSTKDNIYEWKGIDNIDSIKYEPAPFNPRFNVVSTYTHIEIPFNDAISEHLLEKEGYTLSLYLDALLTKPFDESEMPSNDLILYGIWVKNH